jgi:glucose/arabinose dehydrogenase
VPSAFDLTAHPAALGMKFYRGGMFPDEYTNRIFIAEHGSWNRPLPVAGYRVSTLDIDEQGLVAHTLLLIPCYQSRRIIVMT